LKNSSDNDSKVNAGSGGPSDFLALLYAMMDDLNQLLSKSDINGLNKLLQALEKEIGEAAPDINKNAGPISPSGDIHPEQNHQNNPEAFLNHGNKENGGKVAEKVRVDDLRSEKYVP